jgi:hypothetical protein
MRRIAWYLAVIGTACAARVAEAQQTDIIRGRVTGPDSQPVSGVEVRATSYFGNISKTASTDKNGRFTIVFINGEADYWLEFRKLGFAPRRFEVKKVGDEEVLIADTRLMSTIAALDAVNVTAERARALPNRNANQDVSGAERPLANTIAVSPDQAGNLAAMAAGVVGIQLIPGFDGAADMFSVLGLTGDQNSTLFNGLGSGISALPPDILATTSIKPYSFDPAIGGFSGAQISIQTLPGSNFSQRAMSNLSIAPQLEWADTTAESQGGKYTSVRLGGNAAGPLALNRMFYNGAYNIQRRFSDARTLINTTPFGLAAAGLAPDSAARLLAMLPRLGVPLNASVPTTQSQDLVQLASNFDLMPSASGTGHSFVLGGAGNYQRSRPVSRGGLLLTTPSHGGESSFWGANVALVHSNYFWFGILAKTTLGIGGSGSSSEPYVRLPEGVVRVSSTLPDGSASVKPVFFGGSSALSSQSERTIQLTNSSSWYSADNRHTIKVTASIARDAFRSDASPTLQGSFAFNSLADLEAGRASNFNRTFSTSTRSGSQLTATASLGDYWRPTPNVQVQYGLRADANRFTATPESNRAVLETFGLRNDVVPNRAYLSPRIGLQWAYGDPLQIAYAPGSARPPRAVVHAGLGIFQNMASADFVSPALLATGLPSSSRAIACVGEAVPFPDWNAFLTDPTAIPSRCADGSSGSVFASASPNVVFFDERLRQPSSLRAAADWSGPVLDNRFVLGVQGIVSTGRNQIGAFDINLDPTTRFSLASEGGRPVFVDPSAIVPATGSIAVSASRKSTAFQRVTLERSDLRVSARQFSVNLKPVTADRRLKWELTYLLLDAHELLDGFTSTVGNPFETFWSPRLQGGRHSVAITWSDFPVFDVVYLSASLRLFSGQRFTPMIGGDVNGDGYLNDRAFVFDPGSAADSATATSMRALLATGTPAARQCLSRQLGQLAARASCIAPWTTNAVLGLKFNPQKIGLPKRLRLTLAVQNPLGIADLIVHGANDVRGWGQNIPPDQNLLFVRGFDPATRRFKYEVNERFGSTRPQQSTTHALPFISLGFSLDVGMPRERQLLTQRLDLGRSQPGTKGDAPSMKLLGTTIIPNPMNMILQQQDSLKLSRRQADSLASLSYAFSLFADSVWTPVSNELAALPERYDHGDAYRRYVSARERTVDFLLGLVPSAKSVLTPSQRRKLPPQIANYLDERVLRFLRSSSSGDASAVIR